jgi:erythromycin esterase
MIYLCIIGLIFAMPFTATGQEANWFQQSAHQITTIDPNHIDFTDLEPLKKAVGNRRVIMLGEQDHGDGSALTAKIRLIKFLHEEMGFNVLAFESGFYECNRVGDLFHQKKATIDDIQKALYICWRNTSNLTPLFAYLEKENKPKNPLRLTGFDCRHKGAYSESHFLDEFDHFIKYLQGDTQFPERYQVFRRLLGELFEHEYKHEPSDAEQALFLDVLESIQSVLFKIQMKEKDFWAQELLNIRGWAKNAWCGGMADYRDQQMGENLLWLMQKGFPGQKIIVWAHNFHILKNKVQTFDIETQASNERFLSMGTVVNRHSGDDVYVLGFISYAGRNNHMAWKGVLDQSQQIPIPDESHLEHLLNDLNVQYAFVDFLGTSPDSWIRQKHSMKGVQHYSTANEDWTTLFDGIFFIQTMEPSKPKEQ